MNKKLAATILLSLIMTGSLTSAKAEVITPNTNISQSINKPRPSSLISDIVSNKQFTARALTLSKNTKDLNSAMKKTIGQINKTWYVFSGSTPEGWDCSGLVMWTYSHLGFDLYHSATAQMETGWPVRKPKYGDIVGFKYNGSSSYYHVGIYISDDLMLHSGGKRGDKTELRSISDFAGGYSKVSYSRLVDTN